MDEEPINELLNITQKAFDVLYSRKSYKPDDLMNVPEFRAVVEHTANVFSSAVPHEVPQEMRDYLEKDVFVFSGLKTHTQLTEARSYLKDENGNIVPYDRFEQKILKLNEQYNRHYLEAEYQFAVHSAQSAANWANLQENTSRYWLEYRTAGDERVRANHAVLNGICLPKDDDFWTEYYPPNGWRCRCVAVDVLARENTLSDSKKAKELGEKATTHIAPNGKNKLQMFRFNPGAERKVFPPNNAYSKVVGAKKVQKNIEREVKTIQQFKIENEVKSIKDLNLVFDGFSKVYPEYFVRDFKEIKITKQRGVNGFTDMNGNIALKPEVVNLCISGLNNIHKGIPTSFEQERAISTLHHEIWHNANKHGNVYMTKGQIKTMELANEFIARKTLPEFMEKLGGKLYNEELTKHRDNTGYNMMVVNYDKLIKWTEADESKVISSVRKNLVENKYTEQINGLVKAVTENSKYNITPRNVLTLIEYAQKLNNEEFDNLLNNNEKIKTMDK